MLPLVSITTYQWLIVLDIIQKTLYLTQSLSLEDVKVQSGQKWEDDPLFWEHKMPQSHASRFRVWRTQPPRPVPIYLWIYLSSSWPVLPLQVKAQPSALHFPLHSLGRPPLTLPALFLCVPFFPVPPDPGAFAVSAVNRYHLPPPYCTSRQKRRDRHSSATNPKAAAQPSRHGRASLGIGWAGSEQIQSVSSARTGPGRGSPVCGRLRRPEGSGSALVSGGQGPAARRLKVAVAAGGSTVWGCSRDGGSLPPGELDTRRAARPWVALFSGSGSPRVRRDGGVGRWRNCRRSPALLDSLTPSEEGGERSVPFSGERTCGRTVHPLPPSPCSKLPIRQRPSGLQLSLKKKKLLW